MSGAILVTGAAGFAGSHLIDLLSRDQVPVAAWDLPGNSPPFEAPHTTWDEVDLLDAAAVGRAVARLRPSVVYHCAGAAHVGRSWERTVSTFATNVRGTHHLLEALRLAGVRTRVVVPSSAMVYSPASEPLTEEHPLVPDSPYGLSKLAQELLAIRASADGVEVMIARAFNHVGPRQDSSFVAASFSQQIAAIETGRRAPELVVGNLDARRDLTDVRDVVRAYRMILERGRPGRPYNVCSGRAISIRELLDRLVADARVPIRVRVDPARYRPNDIPLLLGSPQRIREELGWTPQFPLEQTLTDLLEYWRRLEAGRTAEVETGTSGPEAQSPQ
jgi:GDP-4-dehydro-6-deoxy-D-mannose reductase